MKDYNYGFDIFEWDDEYSVETTKRYYLEFFAVHDFFSYNEVYKKLFGRFIETEDAFIQYFVQRNDDDAGIRFELKKWDGWEKEIPIKYVLTKKSTGEKITFSSQMDLIKHIEDETGKKIILLNGENWYTYEGIFERRPEDNECGGIFYYTDFSNQFDDYEIETVSSLIPKPSVDDDEVLMRQISEEITDDDSDGWLPF